MIKISNPPLGEISMDERVRYDCGMGSWQRQRRGLRLSDSEFEKIKARRKAMVDEAKAKAKGKLI